MTPEIARLPSFHTASTRNRHIAWCCGPVTAGLPGRRRRSGQVFWDGWDTEATGRFSATPVDLAVERAANWRTCCPWREPGWSLGTAAWLMSQEVV